MQEKVQWIAIGVFFTLLVSMIAIWLWQKIVKKPVPTVVEKIKKENDEGEKKRKPAERVFNATEARLQKQLRNTISLFTTDHNKDTGFAYEADVIQKLFSAIPLAIAYYLEKFKTIPEDENVIPILPIIPENLWSPNQVISSIFTNGKCNLTAGQLQNSTSVPEEPYFSFFVTVHPKNPEEILQLFDRTQLSATANELILTSYFKDSTWRDRSVFFLSNGCLADDKPVTFMWNFPTGSPQLVKLPEKQAREYYLVSCRERICFDKK
ncbi:MAG TPA: hypothetical protein P5230_02005 [Candidatus Magasanikbacteria bacterium]|nr:hypothetical protein [Candidatus Magasanikbacteria bacterium]